MALTKKEIEQKIEFLESQETSPENSKLLMEAYYEISQVEIIRADQKLLFYYGNKGMELAQELGDEIAIGRFHLKRSMYFNYENDFKQSRKELESAVKIFKDPEHWSELGTCYLGIGLSYNGEYKWNEGIDYLFKAADIANENSDKVPKRSLLAIIYCNIGLFYDHLELNDKSIQYQLSALEIAEADDLPYHKGRFSVYLGRGYVAFKEYEKALFYTEQARKIFSELGFPGDNAYAYQNLVNIYKEKGEVEEGLKHLFEAHKLAIESDAEMIKAAIRVTIGDFLEYAILKVNNFSVLEKYDKFEEFALKVLANAEKGKESICCYQMNALLAEYYKRQDKWQQAFKHERAANTIRQERNEEKQQELIAIEQAKLQVHKKDEELNLQKALLEKERAANKKLQELSNNIQEKNLLISDKAKELYEINRELENFAFITSHDLKEPLRHIDDFLGLLKDRYQDVLEEDGRNYINFALEGARRIRKLIEDLLFYTKISNQSLSFESCDLNLIVEKIRRVFETQIKESNLNFKITGNWTKLSGNTEMLEIAFGHLIENAIKYRNENPQLTINSLIQDQHCILSFKDNGIGIESEFQDKVFDIFKRLHNKEEYVGTGIGLSLCKKIVNLHNGNIWLESEEGVGSTFFVKLPLSQEDEKPRDLEIT